MRTLGLLVVLASVCLFAAGCDKKASDKPGGAKKTGQTEDKKDKKDTPGANKDATGDPAGKSASVDDMPEIEEGKGKSILSSMGKALTKSVGEGGDDPQP